MDYVSIPLLFFINIVLVAIAVLSGYKAGNAHVPDMKKQIQTITSSNSTAILGLLGFMLVFTFGIVYHRYDEKKELVREEANIIRTAWQRADFLPEQDRQASLELLHNYLKMRLEAVQTREVDKIREALKEANIIHKQLWDLAVINGRNNMNSDVAALYIESLSEMSNINELRIAVGLETRLPSAIWVILYLLILMGMFAVGYQAAINNSSKKSLLTPVMIITFALIITLIASLDRTDGTIIYVSQQPLSDLQRWMESGYK